jgi:hypothetical protein
VPGAEPTRRQIALEIVIFAVLFALVGAFFVTLRLTREGPRILNYDVRAMK